MRKEYVAPELKLAGEASDVVLGMGGVGSDFFGEILVGYMEFGTDQPDPMP